MFPSYLPQVFYQKEQPERLQSRNHTDAYTIIPAFALVFVPARNDVTAFEQLQEKLHYETQSIIDYFEDAYIGGIRCSNRNNQLFLYVHGTCMAVYAMIYSKQLIPWRDGITTYRRI